MVIIVLMPIAEVVVSCLLEIICTLIGVFLNSFNQLDSYITVDVNRFSWSCLKGVSKNKLSTSSEETFVMVVVRVAVAVLIVAVEIAGA